MSLLCLTVIMPGPEKRSRNSLLVAQAAVSAMLDRFGAMRPHVEVRDLSTGFEAYFLLPMEPDQAKREACAIEDTHPLGRLFDIDVILPSGEPLSRESIGAQPRRCLLCEHEARWCMRNHTHTHAELMARIDEMLQDYVH